MGRIRRIMLSVVAAVGVVGLAACGGKHPPQASDGIPPVYPQLVPTVQEIEQVMGQQMFFGSAGLLNVKPMPMYCESLQRSIGHLTAYYSDDANLRYYSGVYGYANRGPISNNTVPLTKLPKAPLGAQTGLFLTVFQYSNLAASFGPSPGVGSYFGLLKNFPCQDFLEASSWTIQQAETYWKQHYDNIDWPPVATAVWKLSSLPDGFIGYVEKSGPAAGQDPGTVMSRVTFDGMDVVLFGQVDEKYLVVIGFSSLDPSVAVGQIPTVPLVNLVVNNLHKIESNPKSMTTLAPLPTYLVYEPTS